MTLYEIKGDSSELTEWLEDHMPRDKCSWQFECIRKSNGDIKPRLDITVYDPTYDTLFLMKWGDQLSRI
jgi:hypothetical protein